MEFVQSDFVLLPDGGKYFGSISATGLPEGPNGICIWREKKQKYVGNWLDGKVHGRGTMYYLAEGRQVDGMWYCGELLYDFSRPVITTNNSPYLDETTPQYLPDKHQTTALLIGNCLYGGDDNLNNCVSDTIALETKLRSIGIDVMRLENGTSRDIEESIDRLCLKDGGYENVLFFFSGHGFVHNGFHYIQAIPSPEDTHGLLCLEEINERFRQTRYKNRIIIEDACNSIISLERSPISGFPKSKFTEMVGGTLMAFATGLGQTSSDGFCGGHSPYAMALLEFIDRPNMSIIEMFNNVYEFVVDYSTKVLKRPQEPWLFFQHIPMDFTLFPYNG